jgi:hypothetical protein
MAYYVAETTGNYPTGPRWAKTRAKSLAGAKRAARNQQMYQGTWLFIGWKDADGQGFTHGAIFNGEDNTWTDLSE